VPAPKVSYLVAAPSYLSKYGRPPHPLRFSEHRCIGYVPTLGETWHFKWPLKPEDLDWNESRLSISPVAGQQPGNIWIELLSAEITDTLSNDEWLQDQRARLKDSGDRQKKQHTQKWREERIQRFTNTQRYVRDWINFAEIADWCSELDLRLARPGRK
jgi:hypothetical protein